MSNSFDPQPNAEHLAMRGFRASGKPLDEEDADIALHGYEAAAAASGSTLPLSTEEWIAAMERRIRVLKDQCMRINRWADDRPEEAADLLSTTREEIRDTEVRLAHYRAQLDGRN
jgi:hypothetical protein